jgi:hypothetical protein
MQAVVLEMLNWAPKSTLQGLDATILAPCLQAFLGQGSCSAAQDVNVASAEGIKEHDAIVSTALQTIIGTLHALPLEAEHHKAAWEAAVQAACTALDSYSKPPEH